jgi:two-component system phosphate regulon sensor histidine kinase PhoR
MNSKLHWISEVRKIILVLIVAWGLGWLVGQALFMLTIALLALLVYSTLQLTRMHKWLSESQDAPPESVGLWGDVFDRMYRLQRQNSEARKELQSTVNYLRDSFASIRDGAVMLNADGAIEWSNYAAENLLGLSYPNDKGQDILNLVRAPDFHQYFLAADFNSPLQLETYGESECFLRFEITCFGDGDSLMFVRDVTKINRLEQMRKDFVANVSHELRTPLTVISGYLGTMLGVQDSLDKKMVKPLQQMQQQAQRMESLLKDLLWLSRLENMEGASKTDLVDVSCLLAELRSDYQSSYSGRAIEVELETDHKLVGDHRELYSAVSNLLLNALKYSSDDSPVVVSWKQGDREYLLSVADQGIGIDSSHLPRLTERFYRVDDSRSSATGGTGLGLAIVKHVAAGHGAQLRIESVLGVGSKFILAFPA